MEFLPHKDLHDFVFKYDNFSEPVCRYYFLQLLSVLHFLHSNNVYHRDIKPANMLLDENFNLRVCDFGSVGQAYALSGRMTTRFGTPNAMAPEMHTEGSSYNASSTDLFACGAALFYLRTRLYPI
jgi:serine/threonine protein kinase